jgi:hypothetical protein
VRPALRVREYRGLHARDFQHPLDAQNTAVLRALPGLDLLARSMMGPVQEQVRPVPICHATAVPAACGQLAAHRPGTAALPLSHTKFALHAAHKAPNIPTPP